MKKASLEPRILASHTAGWDLPLTLTKTFPFKHPFKKNLPTMWWFHVFGDCHPDFLGKSLNFGEHMFQMGWFKHHLKTSKSLMRLPLLMRFPMSSHPISPMCFLCLPLSTFCMKQMPRVQKFYMVHHIISFFWWIPEKHISYDNVCAIYKRLKQPGRKVPISTKTSKLTWLQIHETPGKQLLKWSIGSFASGFDRRGCMLEHDLAVLIYQFRII